MIETQLITRNQTLTSNGSFIRIESDFVETHTSSQDMLAANRLCEMCTQLGMWPLPADTHGDPLALSSWQPLYGSAFADVTKHCWKKWLKEPQQATAEQIGPGIWLVPDFIHSLHYQRVRVAGLTIDPNKLDSGEAASWLIQYGVDPVLAKDALEHAANGFSNDRIVYQRALTTASQSVIEEVKHTHAINEFCDNLDHAYEELKLLYSLAHTFNSASNPQQGFEAMCEQLLDVSPFQWVATVFNGSSALHSLKDQPIIAGNLPIPAEQLSLQADRLISFHDTQHTSKLLSPKHDTLADMTQSEVYSVLIHNKNHNVGLLLAGNKTGHDSELSSVELQLLQATANYLGVFHENTSQYIDQRKLLFGSLKAFTNSIEAKDPYTCGHSERVAQLAVQLAEAVGFTETSLERVRIAGLVHDVGKIGVPEAVLCKPGKPTAEEFAAIRMHPVIGYKILQDIPRFEDILQAVRSHHERWDGRGYPDNLAGTEIPMIARIMAVADTFDAMSSSRSYRQALNRQTVLAEIKQCAGSQFDPDLVEPFTQLDFSIFDQMLNDQRAQLWSNAA